jgi:hypothetical protein
LPYNPGILLTRGFTKVKFGDYLVNGITNAELPVCKGLWIEVLKCAAFMISIKAHMDRR